MNEIDLRVEVTKAQIKKLVANKDSPLYDEQVRGLALSSIIIPKGATKETMDTMVTKAIGIIKDMAETALSKQVSQGQVERAAELTGLINVTLDRTVAYEVRSCDADAKKAIMTSTIGKMLEPYMHAVHEAGFHLVMVKRNDRYQFEVLTKKANTVLGAAASRDPALAPHVTAGGRFRIDVLTYVDGTPIEAAATEVLRQERWKGTKAYLDQKMVDEGKAKGMRSAVFIGMDGGAHYGLPLFRAWIYKRDDLGRILMYKGKPECIEVDINGSQYVSDLKLNKGKWNNPALQTARQNFTQPLLNDKLIAEAQAEYNSQNPNVQVLEDKPTSIINHPTPSQPKVNTNSLGIMLL